jgi:Fic family protein
MWDFNASMVIEAHKILLEGAVEDSGVDVHAGSHEFPSVLDKVCAEFLRGLVCAEEHPVVTAAKLAQGVVALHPFRNGNGPLCRMLFAVALMWQGVPFGVTLTSGKSRARKHYVEALERAQNSMSADGVHSLYYLSLFSVCEVLGNFASSLTALRIATTGV